MQWLRRTPEEVAEGIESMEKLPGYRWVVFATWQVCSVSGWMMVATIGILLPSISEELTLSPGEQGLLSSIAVWGNLGLAIPLSWLVSRYSPTLVSTITQLLATLFLFAQGWSPSFAILLLGRLGLGMSLIAREPARALITQQWFPHREIPLVNGISNAVFSVIVGGGLIVTPFVLNALEGSWRSTFYLFGALFVVFSVFWIALGRDRVTTEYRGRQVEREVGVIRGALAYRDLWLAGLGFFGAVMSEYAFLSFFPTMMLDTYDVPLPWSGGLMALWLLGGGVFGLVAVYIASNTNNGKRLLQVMGLLMIGTYAGITTTGSFAILVPLSILNGMAWSCWPILMTIPFRLPGIRPREVAVALAFIMMAISGGNAAGPLVAGFAQEALGGDVRLTLFLLSFSGISLTVAGTFLRHGVVGARRQPPGMTLQAE